MAKKRKTATGDLLEAVCDACAATNRIMAPAGPTNGGTIAVKCPNCANTYEVENPHGAPEPG